MKLVRTVLRDILAAIIATDGPLDPAAVWLGVATAIVDNGDLTVMANVTPAPGDVGTRVPIVAWSAPYRMQDGRWVADGPLATFVPASSADACTLTYWYLASALTAGTLVAFGLLPPGMILQDETSMATVVARVTIDPDGRWDVTEAWNG